MATQRIRIGFVGVGGMGQAAHLRNYASLYKECEIVACADLSPNLLRAVRGETAAPCLAPEALEDLRIARKYIQLLRGV